MTRSILALVLVVATGVASFAAEQAAQPAGADDRQITLIAGDLYRVRDNDQYTVFLATRDGIVLADPLSQRTAKWLDAQFSQRFPGVPVRYVVLTHHHADRAAGANLFARTASVVAQEEFRHANARSRSAGNRTVPAPSATYSDRQTIEIGGRARVELIHAGPFHSPDMTVVVFPMERTLFAADPPPLTTVPIDLEWLEAADVVRWLETVSRIDVDRIVFSDGTTMMKEAIVPLAEYLGRMRAAVRNGYERGQSLGQLQRTLRLDAYRTVPHHAAREQHIAAVYSQLSFLRADIIFSGVANYFPENLPEYCAGYDACSAGGVAPGGTVAGLLSLGRRIGVQAEVSLSEQFWSTRIRPNYDEDVVLRPSRGSVLFRYNLTRSRNLSLLAGMSQTVGDVRGMDRVQGRFVPIGGRHRILDHASRAGVVAGVDLSHAIGAVRLIVPLRVTQTFGDLPAYWPSRLSASAGVGLAVPIFRRLE